VERGDVLTTRFDHHFTREEIQHELASAGFELVTFSPGSYGSAGGRAVPGDAGSSESSR
jgi:hypothetical protein